VLSGRIRFGDLMLSAGDYMWIGRGKEHDAEALEDSLSFIAHQSGAVIKESTASVEVISDHR
jgi:quercetin dioxygenase-like cupin family protein